MNTDEVLAAFASHGFKPKRSGEGWAVACPAHEDKNPSCMIASGEKGTLVKCHRGCETADVVARVGLTVADLFYDDGQPGRVSAVSAEYDYRNEHGDLVYQVVRMPGKKFRQRQPAMDGWEWNLKNVERVLFRLPELLDAISLGETVYVCEGEKDVLAVVAAGGVATCNSGGAGKWEPRFGQVLANAERVVIVADNDEPGMAHAAAVAASLNGTRHEIVTAAIGKDAADHLAGGYGLQEFVAPATDAAPASRDPVEPTPPKIVPKLWRRAAVTFDTLRTAWLPGFEGFIPLAMISLLAGLPGLGKSMFGCYLAALETQAGRTVCIAAAEDSIEHTLVPRLVAARADLKLVEFIGYEDKHGDGALLLPDHMHLLEAGLAGIGASLLVVDPIGSFLGRGIDNWRDTDVRGALGPLKGIAERESMAVLLVAHLNKGVGGYLDRLANSAAFGQIIRSGLLWGRDPDDEDETMNRVLVSAKLNVGAPPIGQSYRIDATHVPASDGHPPDIATARLTMQGATYATAAGVLAVDRRTASGGRITAPPTKVPEAVELLTSLLRDGPLPAADVHAAAESCSISRTPLRSAAEQMGIKIERTHTVPSMTFWSLPQPQ